MGDVITTSFQKCQFFQDKTILPLQDSDMAVEEDFRNFTLDPFTVDWNNEIGFAPESLYERGVSV